MLNLKRKALVFLSLNVLGLAFFPIALDVGGSLGAVQFLFYSFLFATALSGIFLVANKKTGKLRDLLHHRRSLLYLIIGGLFNYCVAALLLTVGVMHTSASLAGVVFRAWPLFAVLFIPFMLKTKVNRYQIAALAIGFVAIYFAMTQGTLLNINASMAPYILLLLFSALAAAFSNVIIKGQNVELYTELFVFNISSAAFLGMLMLAMGLPLVGINLPSILAILFIGSVTYFVGAYFYFFSLKVFDPILVGNAMMLVPFLTFVFAYLMLGEAIYPYYLLLALFIIAGIIMQQRSPKKAPERIATKARSMYTIFDITSAFAENESAEIYDHIKGSGRALAASGEVGMAFERLPQSEKEAMLSKYNCILFTSKNPHKDVAVSEINFINDVMGNAEGNFIIGIGDPNDVEKAFNDLYAYSKSRGHVEEASPRLSNYEK